MQLKPDLGLLFLRIVAGTLLLFHGIGKMVNVLAGRFAGFPDPLGIGSMFSLILATFAEFFCSIAVIIGFRTRYAAIPPLITMLVAFFIVHAGQSFEERELPLLYAGAFASLVFTGGGFYSVDTMLDKLDEKKLNGS